MKNSPICGGIMAAAVLSFAMISPAAAGYYLVPVHEITPQADAAAWAQAMERRLPPTEMWKPGVRTAAGTVWLGPANDEPNRNIGLQQRQLHLAIHAPEGGEINGFVDLVVESGKVQGFAFSVDTSKLEDRGVDGIAAIRKQHYQRLAEAELPGKSWFRHLAGSPNPDRPVFARGDDLNSTFAMFSGSRAVAENLALDRELILGNQAADAPKIPIADIQGISVRAIDWSARLQDAGDIKVDPLSLAIPADQHAFFAPSLDALLELAKRVEHEGLPFLRSFAVGNPYNDLIPRYREQLGLNLPDMLARQMKVNGIAITGGDPYFPSGSDVAVVFDPEDTESFKKWLMAVIQVKALAKGAKKEESNAGELQTHSFRNADRSFSSHIATIGRFVIVSNSPVQIERLAAVATGEKEALGSLDEFRFFRHRYALDGGETAFIFISDETIRRWCGPELRIGASRRTRAAAALIGLTNRTLNNEEAGSDYASLLGNHTHASGRILSENFGSLAFMTPISELGIESATEAEKNAYETWRRGYETGWPLVFDPIAIRLTLGDGESGMDMTVLPLTAGSNYESWIEVAGKSKLSPRARTVPEGASVFLSLAIDRDAEMFRGFDQQLVTFLPELNVKPLAWVGESISIWIDEDPLAEIMPGYFMDFESIGMLPLVIRVESRSAMRLSLFLTALRASIEKSAPGMVTWENRTHNDSPYVVVRSNEEMGADLAIYYAPLPGALLVSLDEIALIRSIERESVDLPKSLPEGRHLFAEITPTGLNSFSSLGGRDSLDHAMRHASWSALPILNEWKNRAPDSDPVAFHRERFTNHIQCPGAGGYRWNAEAMTMESTTFGHPAGPLDGNAPESPLLRYAAMRAGLDFEDGGLRVRASAGPAQSRINVELENHGEVLGIAGDYFLNDPAIRLIYQFDEDEEGDDGEWKRVQKTSIERLLPPEENSPLRVMESNEGDAIWLSHFSLENGLRRLRDQSSTSDIEYGDGMLLLPAELRAGAIHRVAYPERGHDEGEAYESLNLEVVRITGHERLEIPAGVFEDALRIEKHARIVVMDDEDGGRFSYTSRDTLWYAKGLGMIKSETHSEGETYSNVLMEIKH